MTRKKIDLEPGPMIRLFVKIATPVMREHFTNDRCLNSTRVCLEVMSAFNVRCKPVSVMALAWNKVWADKSNQVGRLPTDEELSEWVADGGWSLVTDTREESTDIEANVWAGHLVTIVQDHLVDCSAIQMSRPEKNMPIPDIFVGPVKSRFLKGKESLVFGSDDGAFLSYRLRTDDGSWWNLPGFSPSEQNMKVAAVIANAMARVLGRREEFWPKRPGAGPGLGHSK